MFPKKTNEIPPGKTAFPQEIYPIKTQSQPITTNSEIKLKISNSNTPPLHNNKPINHRQNNHLPFKLCLKSLQKKTIISQTIIKIRCLPYKRV